MAGLTDPPPCTCPIAESLRILGDQWTLLILRDLLFAGKSRFSEFAAAEGIVTNTLTDRLNRLIDAGLIARRPDPDDGRRTLYTPRQPAVDLIPILIDIALWGTLHTPGSLPDAFLAAVRTDRAAVVERLRAAALARMVNP